MSELRDHDRRAAAYWQSVLARETREERAALLQAERAAARLRQDRADIAETVAEVRKPRPRMKP